MIEDAKMAQAAAKLAAAINESLPEPDLCEHSFSKGFERRMTRLIRKTSHPVFYRALRSAASIVLILLLGLGSFLAINVNARELVFGWVKRQYQEFYQYFFTDDTSASKKPAEDVRYQPGWMPDGCVFVTSYEITGGEAYIYTNEQETLIQFAYSSDIDTTRLFVDVVNYEKKSVLVDGLPGDVYLSENEEQTNEIVWIDTAENVLFWVSGDFTEDELLKTAESIEKCN